MLHALASPSQNAIVLCGLAIGGIVIASALYVQRDAWVPLVWRRRRLILRVVVAAALVVAIALLVAHRGQLTEIVDRVRQGDPLWVGIGVGLEAISFIGYVVLNRVVYAPEAPHLSNAACVELTLGGVAATRLFSAGGAGGIAFTAWILTRAGMGARKTARHIAAFLVLLYAFYVLPMLLGGILVITGIAGNSPDALGIIAVAVGGGVIAIAIGAALIPEDLEERVEQRAGEENSRMGRFTARLATFPQVAGNAMRLARRIFARQPFEVSAGAIVWWSFDVAVLWAAFHAFGEPPPTATILLCYFLGLLGNLLPVPGGVGGTEGGMLGAFVASGVDASLAVLAVVTYQFISTYLPALPGIAAYASIKRRMKSWPDASAGETTNGGGGSEAVPVSGV